MANKKYKTEEERANAINSNNRKYYLMDMIPVHWKEKLTNFLNN